MSEDPRILSPKDRVSITIDAWKKVVDVQQHFNDLELRIRNLTVTLLGAAVAALGVTSGGSGPHLFGVQLFGADMPLQAPLLVASLILVAAFWGMDRHWYHKLLYGAVLEGARLEQELSDQGIPITLGASISRASPVEFWGYRIRSANKIDLFYLLPATLILVGIILSLDWYIAWIPASGAVFLWVKWARALESTG
jgi:hypothetical protein